MHTHKFQRYSFSVNREVGQPHADHVRIAYLFLYEHKPYVVRGTAFTTVKGWLNRVKISVITVGILHG